MMAGEHSSMWRMAFDIGGTFTDFVLAGSGVAPKFLKVATTPHDPARAVIDGFERLLIEAKVSADDVTTVLHATTVATNAIIERKGVATALITTQGFRDVLIIGRQKRYETYDLYMNKPAPLVARRYIFEVLERIGPHGEVVEALDIASMRQAVESVVASGAQSVAVALLHSYANAQHEQALADCLRAQAPHLPVSLSSVISPKFREYERTSTTVANAYVRPIVARYLQRLESALAERGFANDIFIMHSAGGLISPEMAAEEPVRIVESGPAAGVLMSALVGAEAGASHVITFDMGGTTAKLGAIDEGVPAVTPTFEVDPIRYRPGSGLPINVPAVELLEIGAGGGSIAGAEFGVIHVGPQSAGADPGPMCYGRGGDQPTVTDANLILGYLNPNYFNAGEMALDLELARAGIERQVAQPLGLDIERAAWGVHAAANANMERAMRIVSVERGRDPRRYAIVAFGGAGPVHAPRLAKAIGAPKVIVPFGAGVGSAIGLLRATPRIEMSLTRVMVVNDDIDATVASIFEELERRVRADLSRLKAQGEVTFSRYGYLRYRGQGYEIRADLPDGRIDAAYPGAVREAFHRAYERNYGYRDDSAHIEAVDWHLVASVRPDTASLELGWQPPCASDVSHCERMAWFPEFDGFVASSVYARGRLPVGVRIEGPAIIEDPESTIVVPPRMVATVTASGHLIIDLSAS